MEKEILQAYPKAKKNVKELAKNTKKVIITPYSKSQAFKDCGVGWGKLKNMMQILWH